MKIKIIEREKGIFPTEFERLGIRGGQLEKLQKIAEKEYPKMTLYEVLRELIDEKYEELGVPSSNPKLLKKLMKNSIEV